ncbi:MAG TPA: peptidoglycan-binding domain-containing protein [Gaiellaceae bacterium]|nr:peptidoglycan-binding domain-containing protein [Gaiellaceae bacterium]
MAVAGADYKRFDQASVAEPWHELLFNCRGAGWGGGVNGRRGGARTYAMQLALWQLWRQGRGAPAFAPNGPSRHLRRNIDRLGGWAQAVDVTRPEDLIRLARGFGADLHQPYPTEPWHVEARRPFSFGIPKTGGAPVKDTQLIAVMRQGGIVSPKLTLQEARRAALPLPLACALLEQESSGGHNVFGHDAVRNPVSGGQVTRERYLEYKRYRPTLGMQGVGPCQLTWRGYQDQADALGGCWKPAINMRVGFAVLTAGIRRNGMRTGIRAYNGSGVAAERYADQVLERMRKWERLLGAMPAAQARPARPAPTPPPATRPPAHGPYASDFVALCLRQRGDRYEFGAETSFDDPDPDTFDCSELVEWALHRIGVRFPDGSWAQQDASTLIPIEKAIGVQGALLFRHRGKEGHVAVSLGNRSTIEARGRAYGVNVFDATGRDWTAAGLVPGLTYGAPGAGPVRDAQQAPPWPGRLIMQPPEMRGRDVRMWQQRMRVRGWKIKATGVYDGKSATVCRRFQREKGLVADGVVGPDTWRATWAAPVTPA